MKRGFTLVELLAVIVILAVISIIATPKLVDVIETSRKGAKENSARGYINSVNDQIVSNEFDEETSTIKDGTYYTALLKEVYKLDVSGEEPIEDSWVKIENATVKEYSLKFDKYVVDSSTKTYKGEVRTHDMCILMNAKRKGTKTLGDSYGCDLGDGEIRRFFYLSTEGTSLKLIMDKNLYDSVSYANVSSKITSINSKWDVTASIPTLGQISKGTPSAVYSFIIKDLGTNSFWTTTGIVSSSGHTVTNTGTAGVRPVITISA